ncbi:hypothetical protein B0I26_10175 [Anoxybacillus vitaminiphilus]|uniref:DUF5668 domain-containing protein n=1 Tax=Paranoxybacillus vitaminiphilus TaxID=581036 RepID=A0A327YRF2_9BACL|nr:hypothetical protein [Anoxybacillus vitaminiphilus]RAK23122.1 hypothetical protein B0I26_10175 [Anoxybacillus vitaminiphilus]
MGNFWKYFILLAIGVFFALETFRIVDVYWANLWPLLMFLLGVSIHVFYFLSGSPKDMAFLLLPGGLSLSLGNLLLGDGKDHFVCSLYFLGMAFGLFEWQIFGEEDFSAPIVLTAVLSFIIMFSGGFSYIYLSPFFFIGVCCLLLYYKKRVIAGTLDQ